MTDTSKETPATVSSLSAESNRWTFFKTDFFGKNYCNFKGRASRKEWWAVSLLCLLLLCGCAVVNVTLTTVMALYFLIPLLALTARRFHDLGANGWWVLISPIGLPIILAVVMILGGVVNYYAATDLTNPAVSTNGQGLTSLVSPAYSTFNQIKTYFMMIFGMVSPLIALVSFIILAFIKGKAEDNKYGKSIYAAKE